MTRVYLGLGSNLGNKRKNLEDALSFIKERIGTVVSLSSFYETAPWGFESQNSFLNAAIGVDTFLSPVELLHATQEIERLLGRRHKSCLLYTSPSPRDS